MGSDVYSVGTAWRASVREVVRRGAPGRWSSFAVNAVARIDREFGTCAQAEAALDMIESVLVDICEAAPESFVRAG